MNWRFTEYDLDANHYRNHSSYQFEAATKLIGAHTFREDDHVLDVGCGEGRVTAELSKRVPKGKVVGLDLSESMISLACSSFTKNEYPNLEFHVCNAEDITYTNQFNVVISANCLHWVKDKHAAFQGMMNALIPGGKLLVLMGTKDGGFGNQMEEIMQDDKWKHFSSLATIPPSFYASDCRNLLEELGAKIHVCEVREEIAEFNNKEDFASFIGMWIQYYFPLPEGLREEYLNLVVDHIAKKSLNTEGDKIRLPFKGLIIDATK